MKNGTFNPSKCRGKLQKMGVLYTHSRKSLGPFSKFPKKKEKKREQSRQGQASTCGQWATVVWRPVVACWQRVDAWPCPDCSLFFEFFFLMSSTFCACGQFLLVGSSSYLPCPAQTAPFFLNFFSSCPPLFAHVVNSC
jgi:hypothetical protein